MTPPIDPSRAQSFDAVAEDYEACRPSYPRALFDAVLAHSGLSPPGPILEIGAGTGKATRRLTERGFEVVALEPGAQLAALGRRVCPGATFIETPFEAWASAEEAFDLVVAAQSFHWIDPDRRMALAARSVSPGGHLALLWNLDPGTGELYERFTEVYAAHTPWISGMGPRNVEEFIARWRGEVVGSGAFPGGVEVFEVPWVAHIDAPDYLRLINTYSDHRTLKDEDRDRLFDALALVIDEGGGVVVKPYVAVAIVARR